MSSPFDSSPVTPAYERRGAQKMSVQSPTSSWMLDHATPLNELTWTKNHEHSAVSALDALDLNDVLAVEAAASSGSSSYSESDTYPTFGLHHLPAWSTMTMNRKAQGNNSSSAGAQAAGGVSRGVSPAAGISPSGLSDEGNHGAKNGGHSLGGAIDDLWFLSSPEASEHRSLSSTGNGLQRKKKMHFKPNLPSNRFLGGDIGGTDQRSDDDIASTSRAMLKPTKSLPQIGRRVSSNYTARLEDLLSEMGWPRQEPDSLVDFEEEDGDVTINAASSSGASKGPILHSAPLQHSHSYAGFSQASASPFHVAASSVPSSSGFMTMDSMASGMPAAAPSALFQRRAVAREGSMPSPAPVAIPRRSQDGDVPKTHAGVIPIRMDSRQQPSPAHLIPNSAGPSASEQGYVTPGSAQLLFTQSLDTTAAGQTHAAGAHGPASSSRSGGVQGSAPQQASTSSEGNAGGAYPLFFYGAPVTTTRSSIGSSASAFSNASGNADPAAVRQAQQLQQLPFGVSPASTATRSLTASTASNYTELLTPITPFSNVPLNNANAGQWATMQPFDLQGQQVAHQDLGFGALPIKPGQGDPTLPVYTNALGLYHDPSAVADQGPTLNPTAILDPAAYAHLLGAGVLNPADLSAATKFNRARASTAMAALEMPRSGPRVMRSQPNLRTTPPATATGVRSDHTLAFSTHTTPHKTPRKIASNRRLNMQTPETGSSSLHGTLPPQSPHSPMKRARSGLALSAANAAAASFGAPSTPSGGGGGAFEFINYGIEDADELCSAVAPSGSYKIPLKGFGSASGGEDEDDDVEGNDSDDGHDGRSGGEGAAAPRSPRRARRRTKSTSNRHGPRWEDPAPPLPGFLEGSTGLSGVSSTRSNNDVPLPPTSPSASQAPTGRQVKRRKSDASLMLGGRLKSASMANLRK